MKKLSLILALLWLSLAPAVAQTLVPNLGAAGAVSDTDLMAIYQGASPLKKVTGAQLKTYANGTGIRATTTTTESVLNTDQNKLVTFSNASPVAVSIAQAGSGGLFTSTYAVSLKNLGAGVVTVTAGGTSVFDGGGNTLTLCSGQGVDLYSDGSTGYTVQGGRAGVIACGSLVLATSAISSAACTAAQTLSAPGLLTTDVVVASFNGDPTAVTGYVPLTAGMLTIIVYPTANTFNVKVCNNTTASITPGAITLNLRGVR